MKIIYFIIFILFVSSCQFHKNDIHDLFVGNWNYCERNGQYVELHVNHENLNWCIELEPFGVTFNYEIENDSIYVVNKYKKNKVITAGKIRIINNDKILIFFKEKSGKIDTVNLDRINQKINNLPTLKDLVNVEKYLTQYKERMVKKKCKIKEPVTQKNLGEIPQLLHD